MRPLFNYIADVVSGKAPLGAVRSGKWATVRKTHIKASPTCAVCGGTSKITVHHLVPFHIDPSKELDPTNLITLCESWNNGVQCHLWFGHLGNYKDINPDVLADTKIWNKKVEITRNKTN